MKFEDSLYINFEEFQLLTNHRCHTLIAMILNLKLLFFSAHSPQGAPSIQSSNPQTSCSAEGEYAPPNIQLFPNTSPNPNDISPYAVTKIIVSRYCNCNVKYDFLKYKLFQ